MFLVALVTLCSLLWVSVAADLTGPSACNNGLLGSDGGQQTGNGGFVIETDLPRSSRGFKYSPGQNYTGIINNNYIAIRMTLISHLRS